MKRILMIVAVIMSLVGCSSEEAHELPDGQICLVVTDSTWSGWTSEYNKGERVKEYIVKEGDIINLGKSFSKDDVEMKIEEISDNKVTIKQVNGDIYTTTHNMLEKDYVEEIIDCDGGSVTYGSRTMDAGRNIKIYVRKDTGK